MSIDEAVRFVRGLDAREYLALAVADVERQREQLVGTLDGFGLHDFRDAQVDLHEVIDRDHVVLFVGCGHRCTLFRLLDHAIDLLGIDACQQRFEFVDRGAEQGLSGILPDPRSLTEKRPGGRRRPRDYRRQVNHQ